jgi:hypothetical protein
MRNRSSAISLTQNAKKRLSDDIGLTIDMLEEVRKEKLTNYLTEKLKNDNIKITTTKDIYHVSDIPPPYLDIRKDYHSKQEKVNMYSIILAYSLP